MNKDIQKGGWKVLKGRMQAQWGKLTDQELEEFKGNATALAGKLQVYYGKTKQAVEQEINELKMKLRTEDNLDYDEYFPENRVGLEDPRSHHNHI